MTSPQARRRRRNDAGNQVQVANGSLNDFRTDRSYQIMVRTTDAHGLSIIPP